MKTLVMLTTVDNPHDPFIDFGAWYAYDVSSGYHTAQFLARIVKDSDQLSEADQDIAILNAINEIVQENVLGIYRKVVKEVPD
jgi:hypothetical protein